MRLTRIAIRGNLIVYRRQRGHETWLPLYVVGHKDGRMLEEFRRLRSALRWATANAKGGR